MITEFKEFAVKGNMMDMAVGIVTWCCVWHCSKIAGIRYPDARSIRCFWYS